MNKNGTLIEKRIFFLVSPFCQLLKKVVDFFLSLDAYFLVFELFLFLSPLTHFGERFRAFSGTKKCSFPTIATIFWFFLRRKIKQVGESEFERPF